MSFFPNPLPTSVPTAADLATGLARTKEYGVLSTTGRATPGDGGAASYVYYRSGRSTVTIDNGMRRAGPGVDDYFELTERSVIPLAACDVDLTGTVDGTAAWQATVDAIAAAGGGILFVSPGTYKINGTISIPPGVSVIGETRNAFGDDVVINHTPASAAVLFDATSVPSVYSSHGQFGNLTIQGNEQSSIAIDCYKSKDLRIFNCLINDFNVSAIRLRSSIHSILEDVTVRMRGASNGVSVDFAPPLPGDFNGTTVTLHNCYLRQGDYCFRIGEQWSSVVFDTCIFESTRKGIGDIHTRVSNVRITNCHAEYIGFGDDGAAMFDIGVGGRTGLFPSSTVSMDACTFGGAGTPGYRIRPFLNIDAVRAVMVRDCEVILCWHSLLNTTVYTGYVSLDNITTNYNEQNIYGTIYDWAAIRVNKCGNEYWMRGGQSTTAGQQISIVKDVTDTTIHLPAGAAIDSVDVHVPDALSGTWELDLIGGATGKLLTAQARSRGTKLGVAISPASEYITTRATDLRVTVTPAAFTADAGTDLVTSVAHGLIANQLLRFQGADLPSPIAIDTDYYVVSVTDDSFAIASTSGGAAIDITDAGSGSMTYVSGTMRLNIHYRLARFHSNTVLPTTYRVDVSNEPTDLTTPGALIWQSNGTGIGNDGDLIAKVLKDDQLKIVKLVDYATSISLDRNLWGVLGGDFGNIAYWVVAGTSVFSDVANAPDGTATADRLAEAATTSSHIVLCNKQIVAGKTYCLSVWAKAGERDKFTLYSQNITGHKAANFDLTNGTCTTRSGADTPIRYGMIPDVDGWYRCWIVYTAHDTNELATIGIDDGTGSHPTSYLGDITKGLFLAWGQLEEGIAVSEYVT